MAICSAYMGFQAHNSIFIFFAWAEKNCQLATFCSKTKYLGLYGRRKHKPRVSGSAAGRTRSPEIHEHSNGAIGIGHLDKMVTPAQNIQYCGLFLLVADILIKWGNQLKIYSTVVCFYIDTQNGHCRSSEVCWTCRPDFGSLSRPRFFTISRNPKYLVKFGNFPKRPSSWT